jgi:flagellar hook-associated protein 1 FlgK
MSLISSLNIAQSGLTVSQAALQVTGNNISNAGNANYTREVANISALPDQQIAGGILVGTGVDLSSVQRQADDALNARLNSSNSDNQAATVNQQWSNSVESIFNALGSGNISTQLNTFLNDWSNLANSPADSSLRQVVVQDGTALAQQFNGTAGSLLGVQGNVSSQITSLAETADQLSQQIATLNGQLAVSQSGPVGSNNGLLDERDAEVKQLSSLINVQTVPQGNGTVNVYVGTEPLVVGTTSNGLTTQVATVNGQATTQLAFKSNGANVPATSGQLGGLLSSQTQVQTVLGQLNTLAGGLIFGLNSLQASGQGTQGYTSVTGTTQVLDPTVPLTSATAGLPFTPVNGSFVINSTNTTTGLTSSTLVPVNLTGQPTDTTLNSLTASLNAIPNVSASIVGGQLQIAAANGTQITFSQDSSHVLASLGVNTFFQGKDAQTIGVNPVIVSSPKFIAAAMNGNPGDNQTALAISQLGTQTQQALGGTTLNAAYQSMIDGMASTTAAATNQVTATQEVQSTLQSQKDSLSGVSLDEEAINLIKQQQAYQGAARLVSTIDAMMASLFAIT